MSRINYAAIDIGSNAVRLLIKSISSEAVGKQQFKKILFLRIPLRLGLDIFSDGELSERKARKLERLMKAYRHLMNIYDVRYYRACATSAMRDAKTALPSFARLRKTPVSISKSSMAAKKHASFIATISSVLPIVIVPTSTLMLVADPLRSISFVTAFCRVLPPATLAHCVFS